MSSSSVNSRDQVSCVRALDARPEEALSQDDSIDYLLNIAEGDEDAEDAQTMGEIADDELCR